MIVLFTWIWVIFTLAVPIFVNVAFMTFLLLLGPQFEQKAIFSNITFSVILLVLLIAVVDKVFSKTLRLLLDQDTTALPRTATALSIIPAVTIVLRPLRRDFIFIIISSNSIK